MVQNSQYRRPHNEKSSINGEKNVNLKRIDSHYISHELFHLWHLDKGFLYNVKELTIRPAKSIKEFLHYNRERHMKPIGFLIFSAIIYTLIYNSFKPSPINVASKSYFYGTTTYVIQSWLGKNFGYDFIFKSFFTACWARIFFNKYGYNIFEIMTLMCFVSAQAMLFTGVILPFNSLLHQTVNNIILLGITIFYPVIVLAQFFDKTKVINYLKALITYFLGGITLYLLVIAIGYTFDFFISFFK